MKALPLSESPAKTDLPMYCVFAWLIRSLRMPSSSVAIASRDAGVIVALLAP